MSLPTLTIGIPAHNESANIGSLLTDLKKQDYRGLKLDRIIVYSDASTDSTNDIVREFSRTHPLIRLVSGRSRTGKTGILNYLYSHTNTDALLVLDADISLPDPRFVRKTVTPILSGRADLTSTAQRELPPGGFFERILHTAMEIKNQVYASINRGNNIYTFHGHANALSRRLYSGLQIPVNIGEDGYLFLYCRWHKFRYHYVPEAASWYKLPGHFGDHEKQSRRFYLSKALQKKYFPEAYVDSQYRLPVSLVIKKSLSHLVHNPVFTILSAALLVVTEFYSRMSRNTQLTRGWSPSVSSKSYR